MYHIILHLRQRLEGSILGVEIMRPKTQKVRVTSTDVALASWLPGGVLSSSTHKPRGGDATVLEHLPVRPTTVTVAAVWVTVLM